MNQTWRRRRCENCGGVFTTIETVDWYSSLAVSKNTALEPFSRDKLFISLIDSLKHRETVYADATALTNTIINKLLPFIDNASLQSSTIRQVTAETLRNFDHAGFTHYTAFHP